MIIIQDNPQDTIKIEFKEPVKKEWKEADSISIKMDYLIHKLDSLKRQ